MTRWSSELQYRSTQKINPHNPKEKELVLEMKERGLLEWIILSDLKKETLNLA